MTPSSRSVLATCIALATTASWSPRAPADATLESLQAFLTTSTPEEIAQIRKLVHEQRAARLALVQEQIASLDDRQLLALEQSLAGDASPYIKAGMPAKANGHLPVAAGALLPAAALSAAESDEVKTVAEAAAAEKVQEAKDSEESVFGKLGFGVAISLTHDLGDNDRIDDAQLAGGVVRVSDEGNDIARIMLETHYFFTPAAFGSNIGVGPFVSVQPGSDDIIDAVGFGMLFGVKRTAVLGQQSSFNLGVGAVVDPNARVLADGIVANQPLPAGESAIRFKEKSQWGLLFLSSYSWN